MVDELLPDEPADSREEIMRATYVAIEKYGYAGLSIQRIADETDLSKSTFYHHFDGKDDLLRSFVEFILGEFTALLQREAGDDPTDFIQMYVNMMSSPGDIEFLDSEHAENLLGAYVELRAQAVQDDQFRAKFTEIDRAFETRLAGVIREGIASGTFKDVDPESFASLILTLDAGHVFRATTRDDDPTGSLQPELGELVRDRLFREDS